MDIQVNGVQSVYAEVAVRLAVLVFIGGQVIQIDSFSIYDTDGHLLQWTREFSSGKIKFHTFFITIGLSMNHFSHHVIASDEASYGGFYVCRGQSVVCQNERVVCNFNIFAYAPCHLDTAYIFKTLQFGFHLPLDVFFQLLIAQVGIYLIG